MEGFHHEAQQAHPCQKGQLLITSASWATAPVTTLPTAEGRFYHPHPNLWSEQYQLSSKWQINKR